MFGWKPSNHRGTGVSNRCELGLDRLTKEPERVGALTKMSSAYPIDADLQASSSKRPIACAECMDLFALVSSTPCQDILRKLVEYRLTTDALLINGA